MQLFNQLNARKLEEGEFNIFEGIFRNPLFIAVVIFTFVIQMVIVEVGDRITKTYPLNKKQNLFCIAFGSGELIWGILIKFMPLSLFQCVRLDEAPVQEEAPASLTSTFKKSATKRSGALKDWARKSINIDQNLNNGLNWKKLLYKKLI